MLSYVILFLCYLNERAHNFAKDGSMQDQPEVELSFQEANTLLKHKSRSDWRTQNGNYNPKQDSIRTGRHHISSANRPLPSPCPPEKDSPVQHSVVCLDTSRPDPSTHLAGLLTVHSQEEPDLASGSRSQHQAVGPDLENTAKFMTSTGLVISMAL